MKKLTSERLGREGLAAWEDRKSNADPEIIVENKENNEAPDEDIEDAEAEPEVGEGQDDPDEEAQTQHGTKAFKKFSPISKSLSSSILEASVAF